jgi:hypothetical protein
MSFSWVPGDRVRLKKENGFFPGDDARSRELREKQLRAVFLRMSENDPDGPEVCWVEFEGSYLGETRVMAYDLEPDPDPTPLRFQTVQEKLQGEAMGRALERALAASRASGKEVHVDVGPISDDVRKKLS